MILKSECTPEKWQNHLQYMREANKRYRRLHKSWRESNPDRIEVKILIVLKEYRKRWEEKCKGDPLASIKEKFRKKVDHACHWIIHNKENTFSLKIVCPEKSPLPSGRPRKQ